MVDVPPETPVTIPVEPTVATLGILLVQVPPVIDGVINVESPAQTEHVPVDPHESTGTGLTVTSTVEKLPTIAYVMVAMPAETPSTSPAVPTVAMPGAELLQVPPGGVQDRVVMSPTQILNGVPVIGPVCAIDANEISNAINAK
jgi:hypothetical protein